ncbi:nitroreductase family protein [Pinibacter aurantiacus]|uniref:Nitroreductase n=1 Tax=Pinibacter aurantiacus TaxID=2851599 RepID=A0A9E2W5A6_9BACT|nr:nitroreductase [Pinibacter aurantiacus]MBV4358458.1 nitroreductase [Pinibacter aurantiacus]
MSNDFSVLETLVKDRRTVKAQQMNGKKIPDAQIVQLLELADWAPTHANTEPWRFFVYGGSDVQGFCKQHAELWKQTTPPENFLQGTYDKFATMGDAASHVIIAAMKRAPTSKIPVMEEIAATACAVQNILLGAEALGIATFWSTGGMTLKEPFKPFLHLNTEDVVMGIIYLGYSDVEPAGKRLVPLEDKVRWNGGPLNKF